MPVTDHSRSGSPSYSSTGLGDGLKARSSMVFGLAANGRPSSSRVWMLQQLRERGSREPNARSHNPIATTRLDAIARDASQHRYNPARVGMARGSDYGGDESKERRRPWSSTGPERKREKAVLHAVRERPLVRVRNADRERVHAAIRRHTGECASVGVGRRKAGAVVVRTLHHIAVDRMRLEAAVEGRVHARATLERVQAVLRRVRVREGTRLHVRHMAAASVRTVAHAHALIAEGHVDERLLVVMVAAVRAARATVRSCSRIVAVTGSLLTVLSLIATFYEAGLGACGITNSDADMIVAIDAQTFDSFPGATGNPNTNPICNKKITATTTDGKFATQQECWDGFEDIIDQCYGSKDGGIYTFDFNGNSARLDVDFCNCE
ncbi:hypothetical protein NUW54_g7013 [Trametes sanguinea]|uniref:Uncharacterized protein n=1 Tax=Trametes sanguinea TaxID=158606 RepID=A0ACC1PR21_9APHY|nr:hypothetical protein NUW54_g7013 [Trametes sanguinea]